MPICAKCSNDVKKVYGDRGCFMPGVILAARRVGEHPGVTVGLADYLDL